MFIKTGINPLEHFIQKIIRMERQENILYDPVQISMIKRENVQLNWIMVHNFYSENDRVFKNDVQSTSPSEQ